MDGLYKELLNRAIKKYTMYPGHSLERNISNIIDYFFEGIIIPYLNKHEFGYEYVFHIPEFPIPQTKEKNKDKHRKTKQITAWADYLCLIKREKAFKILLVELKTEENINDNSQYENYKKATSWSNNLKHLKDLTINTKNSEDRVKYFNILIKLALASKNAVVNFHQENLEEIEKIINENREDFQAKNNRTRQIKELVDHIDTECDVEIEVVYIDPRAVGNDDEVEYKFSEILDNKDSYYNMGRENRETKSWLNYREEFFELIQELQKIKRFSIKKKKV